GSLSLRDVARGPLPNGTQCGQTSDQDFLVDSTFTPSPSSTEGFLPNRHGVVRLFTPGGTLVDQVAYGDSGGAPVSAGVPSGFFATAPPPDLSAAPGPRPDGSRGGDQPAAVGDSVPVSTSRIPNGTDTGNDATDFNLTPNNTPGSANA